MEIYHMHGTVAACMTNKRDICRVPNRGHIAVRSVVSYERRVLHVLALDAYWVGANLKPHIPLKVRMENSTSRSPLLAP